MELSRRNLIVSGLAGAALPLFGIRGAFAADAKKGGTLILSSSVEPVHLVGAFTTQAGPPTAKIFDGLIRVDFEGKIVPALAESWEIAPDGLGYTFHLRKDVTFHDGTPLTADDVDFSLAVWKQYHARGRGAFANVTQTELPDAHTIVLKLSAPAPALLLGLVATESPVLSRKSYPSEGDLAVAQRNNEPIGTGPFRFVEWERGSHIALERNPDYWDAGKPYVDQLIIRTLPDQASNAAAIEAGSVQHSTFIPLSSIARLKTNPKLQIVDDPRANLYQVGAVAFEFNLDRERFRDKALRTALLQKSAASMIHTANPWV